MQFPPGGGGVPPCLWKPQPSSTSATLSMGSSLFPAARWKGVASMKVPPRAPALLFRLSSSMPMVIRDGNACGLMIRSGLGDAVCRSVSHGGTEEGLGV